MSRETFMLAGFALLSLYGALTWRVAWTAEMPKALRDAEKGWRLRLAVALMLEPPTRRFYPALFVWAWTAFLFAVADVFAEGLAGPLAICMLAALLLVASVTLFNRPRFIVPPYARDEPGIVGRWLRELRH